MTGSVEKNPFLLKYIPDKYKTEDMCNNAVNSKPWVLQYVPDQFKTQDMCDSAVDNEPRTVSTMYQINTKLKKCVKRQFLKTHL